MRDDVDQILENAVESYAAVEPSPELASRILERAQHVPAPRRGWKLALAFAVPLAAALALAFVLAGQWALPKPPAAVASAPTTPDVTARTRPQPAETLAAAPVQTHRSVRKAHAARSTARPLPAPYSKEELALLAFVQQHPKEAAEMAEAQKRDSAPLQTQPITISRLEIKPLTIAPLP
ncbi:MAG: hypothetical protein WAM66_08855 [Acidobacteriaceae bacterium]